jgi:hypothetical protein
MRSIAMDATTPACRQWSECPPRAGRRAAPAVRHLTWLLLAAALMAALGCVRAAAAPATYSGEAPVTSQSEAERAGALKSALADVVIRLSNDPGILARGDVARAVADADKYVLQYRYRRDDGIDETSGAATTRLVLVAEFDSSAVDRMLAGLGLAGAGAAATVDATPVERRIWISGIHSADDYARGMGYLARQSLVRQAWPLQARGDGILVRLSVAGGLDRWLEAVDREGVLRVNSASPPLDGIDATLMLSQ